MSINTSGEWWRGSEPADITTYLESLKPGGYPVNRVVHAVCDCGSTRFDLFIERENELARTVCCSCKRKAFVSDSESHWSAQTSAPIKCPCGCEQAELGLGLCIREDKWVRWMSLGTRCVACGVLGSPLDWKCDLDLSDPDAIRIGG